MGSITVKFVPQLCFVKWMRCDLTFPTGILQQVLAHYDQLTVESRAYTKGNILVINQTHTGLLMQTCTNKHSRDQRWLINSSVKRKSLGFILFCLIKKKKNPTQSPIPTQTLIHSLLTDAQQAEHNSHPTHCGQCWIEESQSISQESNSQQEKALRRPDVDTQRHDVLLVPHRATRLCWCFSQNTGNHHDTILCGHGIKQEFPECFLCHVRMC